MFTYNKIEQLRSYSTIFSNMSFLRLINEDDFSFIDKKIERFDNSFKRGNKTYRHYIKYVYDILSKDYRCEYIYKNTLINELLGNRYSIKDTIAINEFKVADSIVDLAMFNGTSKAFEIKTELDSPKRLATQLKDYRKLFNECYIVTHESLSSKYLQEDSSIGIIILYNNNKTVRLEEIRPAKKILSIDPEIAIRCLRTKEYKNIIQNYYGEIPRVSSFKMFEECLSLLKDIPSDNLNSLILLELKKRSLHKNVLTACPKELKHICLSLNLSQGTFSVLEQKLNQYI
jgi:hypothetical protein